MNHSSAGRAAAHAAFARLLPPQHTPAPLALVDLLGEHLDDYAEIIVGAGRDAVGFMTRGEDPAFTERVAVALEHLGMSEETLAHHRALATWFEHRRAFAKLEWHPTAGGSVEPLAACYFRRRPSVVEVCDRLASWNLGAETRELVAEVGKVLAKDTVHFVSAAFRPAHPVRHKLYFSQLVNDQSRAAVTARLAQMFRLLGLGEEVAARWRETHDECSRPIQTTVFVSVSFSQAGVDPSFKIDYPGVSPEQVSRWAAVRERAAAQDDATLATSLAGTRRLSFLGVRFRKDAAIPSLKYYCDVPR